MTTTLTVIRNPALYETFTVQEMNEIVRHGILTDAIRPTHISQKETTHIPLWKLMPQLQSTITSGEIDSSITARSRIGAPQAYLRFADLLENAKHSGGCTVKQGQHDSALEQQTA